MNKAAFYRLEAEACRHEAKLCRIRSVVARADFRTSESVQLERETFWLGQAASFENISRRYDIIADDYEKHPD